MLKPYWIETNKPLSIGYGITARSQEDAGGLLRLTLSGDYVIISIEPVDDLASLDQGHVIPNMGNIFRRGIWFPLGLGALTD